MPFLDAGWAGWSDLARSGRRPRPLWTRAPNCLPPPAPTKQSVAAQTNWQTFSDSKPFKFIISLFHGQRPSRPGWLPCSGPPQGWNKGVGLCSNLEALGRVCPCGHSFLVGWVRFHSTIGRRALFPCWPSAPGGPAHSLTPGLQDTIAAQTPCLPFL